MKTTSVALFLALSAGYLSAANATSLNNNFTQVNKETLTSNQDADTKTNPEKSNHLAANGKVQS